MEDCLGLRPLTEWSKATMLMHSWALSSKKTDSWWVKWVRTSVIKHHNMNLSLNSRKQLNHC